VAFTITQVVRGNPLSNLNSAFDLVANTAQEANVLQFTHCINAAQGPVIERIAWS